jgi:hypothetical protein
MKHITAALVALTAIVPARFAEATIIPGNSCALNFMDTNDIGPNSTNNDPDMVFIGTNTGNITINQTSNNGQVLVSCGPPRISDTLTGSIYFRLYNSPQGADESVSCTFYSIDSSDTTSDFETVSTSSTGHQSLSFAASNLTVYASGKYSAYCSLRQFDWLRAIRYND